MRNVPRAALPLAVGAIVFAAMLALGAARPPGLSWDEAYYYPTFVDVATWLGGVSCQGWHMVSAEEINAGWGHIHELPPLVKLFGAVSVLPELRGPNTLAWMRVVPALAFAAAAALLCLIGRRLAGTGAGVLAAVLYTLHPHLFGNAQLAATETIFCAVSLAAIHAALGDLSRWRGRIALAAWVGLALATKANGLVLAAGIGAWLLMRRSFSAGRALPPGRDESLAIVSLTLGAPIVAFAIWPWMWHDTATRVAEYFRFVTEHAFYGVWFLGRRWSPGDSPVPATYPIVMTFATAPLVWMAAIAPGAFWMLIASLKRRRISPAMSLLAILAAAPLVAASLPGTPRYDAIRLFQPMFAPLILFAVVGAARWARMRRHRIRPEAIGSIAAVIALEVFVLAPAPFPLSWYNGVARVAGARGEFFPLERTYWGEAVDADVVRGLNALLPPNANVKTLALQEESFAILQRWGVLRRDLKFGGAPPYDAHLLLNRRGFWGNAEWSIFTNREPLASWHPAAPGGEPLVWLFDGRPPGAD